ncbi:MAG: tetratricopeptide repeat protein [Endomicrobia bacterium]|nr:tetratricopeptide repeat protein [Endomicrobiia bacterium]
MKCYKCGFQNRDTVKFCTNCGSVLKLVCTNCGSVLLPEYRFCGDCGTPVDTITRPNYETRFSEETVTLPTSADIEELIKQPPFHSKHVEERREITVVYVDLTDFAKAMDIPATIKHNLFQETVSKITEIIRPYEGYIHKVLHDSVLLLFGLPVKHEDDTERAVFSAIEIRTRLNSIFAKFNLQPKITINTGEAVWMGLGSELKYEYTVIGDVVNTCAHMRDVCQQGQILITEQVCKKVEGKFSVHLTPIKNIRGKKEIIKIYEVVGVSEEKSFLPKRRWCAKLVGRDIEIALLKKHVDKLLAGESAFIAIVGEAGIGKSRLIYELYHNYLVNANVCVLKGRCISYARTTPYFMFMDILKQLFGITETDGFEDILSKIKSKSVELEIDPINTVPPLCFLLGIKQQEVMEKFLSLGPFERKKFTFNTITALLLAQAKKIPLVLIAEDLHWVDPASYELLTEIITKISTVPLMVIALYRPEFKHNWSKEKVYNQLSLTPLTKTEIIEMTRSILQTEKLSEDLETLLYKKTEGNPFFIEEILRVLIETKIVTKKDDQYVLSGSLEKIKLPDTIQGIVLSRIDVLPEDVIEVLKYASVVGRIFSVDIIKTFIQKDIENLLKKAEEQEIIFLRNTVPEKEYIFRHVLIQESIYQSIPLTIREKIHYDLATYFEKVVPENYEIIAYHYSLTQAKDKAVEYLVKSGEKALRVYATDAAIETFSKAVEFAESLNNPHLICKTKLKLGTAYFAQGKLELALTEFKKALSIAEEINSEIDIMQIEFEKGRVHRRFGELNEAEKSFQHAMQLASKLNQQPMLVMVYHRLATLARDKGDKETAQEYIKKALDIAEVLGDKKSQAIAYEWLALFSERDGDVSKAEELYTKALEIEKAIGNRCGEVFIYRNMGVLKRDLGNFKSAIEYFEKALTIAESINDRSGMGWVYYSLGEAYLRIGELEKALRYTMDGLSISKEMGYKSLEANILNVLASINRRLGKYEEAEEIMEEALEIATNVEDYILQTQTYIRLGATYRDTGKIKEAKKCWEEALRISQQNNDIRNQAFVYPCIALLEYHKGDFLKAIEYYEKALEIETNLKNSHGQATIELFLAEIWHYLGDMEKIVKHLDIAKELIFKNDYKDLMVFLYIIMSRYAHLQKELDLYKTYCEKALQIADQLGYVRSQAMANLNLSIFYSINNEIDKALNFALKGLELIQSSKEQFEYARHLFNIGAIYYNSGDLTKAKEYLFQAERYAVMFEQNRHLIIIYHFLGKIFEKEDRLKEALENYIKSFKLRKELISLMPEKTRILFLKMQNRKKLNEEIINVCNKLQIPVPQDVSFEYTVINNTIV